MLKVATTAVFLCTLAGAAQAQTSRSHFGPRVSYQFDVEEVGLGVQLGLPVARHLEFYPSFDYFFVDPGSFWNLNGDIKYRLDGQQIRWLYVGTGLNIAHRSLGDADNTDAGLNLFGGLESLSGRIHPFAEFRFTVSDNSAAMIAGGLNITLGRH
jgi:hypothetical protein